MPEATSAAHTRGMDLAKIRELSRQLNDAATDADRDWPGSVGVQSADALNYAADEIERLSKVARLGWKIVWSDALFGGFDTTKSDAEAVAKERLAQADAALKSIRPVSDLSGPAQHREDVAEIERLRAVIASVRGVVNTPSSAARMCDEALGVGLGPFLLCPGTKPCVGSGVSRDSRACPNCGERCVPYPVVKS